MIFAGTQRFFGLGIEQYLCSQQGHVSTKDVYDHATGNTRPRDLAPFEE